MLALAHQPATLCELDHSHSHLWPFATMNLPHLHPCSLLRARGSTVAACLLSVCETLSVNTSSGNQNGIFDLLVVLSLGV